MEAERTGEELNIFEIFARLLKISSRKSLEISSKSLLLLSKLRVETTWLRLHHDSASHAAPCLHGQAQLAGQR